MSLFDDDPAGAQDDELYTAAGLARCASELEWIVSGLIPSGNLLIAAGSPKVGRKTWLLLHVALCVSQGKPLFGRPVKRRPVLYVALEDGKERIARRFKALGAGELTGMDEVALTVRFGQQGLEQAMKTVKSERVLCVVDPLACATAARNLDENDAADMTNFIQQMREPLHGSGSTLILAHHFRKAGDMMRGSGAINAATDGWLDLAATKDGSVKMSWTLRDGEPGVCGYRVAENGGSVVVEACEVKSNGVSNGKDANPIDLVRVVLVHHPAGLQLGSIASEARLSKRKVTEILERMDNQDEAVESDGTWTPTEKLIDLLARRAEDSN